CPVWAAQQEASSPCGACARPSPTHRHRRQPVLRRARRAPGPRSSAARCGNRRSTGRATLAAATPREHSKRMRMPADSRSAPESRLPAREPPEEERPRSAPKRETRRNAVSGRHLRVRVVSPHLCAQSTDVRRRVFTVVVSQLWIGYRTGRVPQLIDPNRVTWTAVAFGRVEEACAAACSLLDTAPSGPCRESLFAEPILTQPFAAALTKPADRSRYIR